MISAAAIAAALAFWSPYNAINAPLPCSAQNVHEFATPPPEVPPDAAGYAFLGPGRCDVWIHSDAERANPQFVCAVLAHEWGHAFFGLRHSEDPSNIMFAQGTILAPASHFPPRRRRVGTAVGHSHGIAIASVRAPRTFRQMSEAYDFPKKIDLAAVGPRLASQRRAGATFEAAWRHVVGASTLADSKAAWRRAFEREPPTQADRAAAMLWRVIADPSE